MVIENATRRANDTDDVFSVAGKTAVVTGGSRGIGEMVARGLVLCGADVIITSRNGQRCQAAADLMNAAADRPGSPGRCTAVASDLSSAEGAGDFVEWLSQHRERLDSLVNNAGATWGAPLQEFPVKGWVKVLNTNLVAPFYLISGSLPLLRNAARDNGPARVINIGSVDGLAPPDWENYPYTASKAGVHMMTRQLAKKLASQGITVNAIAPGPVLTDMLGAVAADPDAEARLLDQVPLGRYGTAVDLVGTVRYLASPAGAYLTGVIIPLDGGISGCAR